MSQIVGSNGPPASVSANGRPAGLPDVPAAVRARRPGWRDPRLWVGVAIVAGSVLLGAKVVGDADESVAVWAVTSDLGPGDELTSGDLAARDVRFVQAGDADGYLSADEPVPEGTRVTRDVGAGELLPRSALDTGVEVSQQTMTFEFDGPGVPEGLGQGDRVDVFVTTTTAQSGQTTGQSGQSGGTSGGGAVPRSPTPPTSTLVLQDLVVTSVSGTDAGLGAGAVRAVTVGVPAEIPAGGVAAAVQAAKTGNVFLVKQG